MSDEIPPEVGWLHYRLAVAFCSAFVMGVMLLLVPLVIAMSSATPRLFVMYNHVFSKWGVAALLATAVIGFLAGGERMANFFAIIWGTHPFWTDLESWLWEHKTASAFIGWGLVALTVGFFWFSFR